MAHNLPVRNRLVGIALVAATVTSQIGATPPSPPVAPEITAAAASPAHSLPAIVDRGVAFLRTQQDDQGAYSPAYGVGVTALVTVAMLRQDVPIDDSQVAASLAYLQTFEQPDGGIYQAGSLYRNYETSLVVMCLAAANADGRFDEKIRKADAFLKNIQWDEGENVGPDDPAYGGGGYGKHQRPDLSNTNFLIDALQAAGNDVNSDAIQRALKFVSRCQNIGPPYNDTEFGKKNPDGGFYYTPAAGGQSQAGEHPQGGLRSYGSMTYAGLKSMIYAGVGPDDYRVQAALKWLSSHYRLDENPGMGTSGLYYYYHTFAKSLAAVGRDQFVDADGVAHSWKQELIDTLASKQRPDGAWVNADERWLEDDASLVTGYALLALSYCK